jgi:hypothetical protein
MKYRGSRGRVLSVFHATPSARHFIAIADRLSRKRRSQTAQAFESVKRASHIYFIAKYKMEVSGPHQQFHAASCSVRAASSYE